MKPYWLDSGALIQAERAMYPREQFPPVWTFLEQHLTTGDIRMSERVRKELLAKNDSLGEWCRHRKGFARVFPVKAVQDEYRRVVAHVSSNTTTTPWHNQKFCNGADGWIIAHAIAQGGTVVTEELRHPTGFPIKVPTICNHFRVRHRNLLEMLRELGFKLV